MTPKDFMNFQSWIYKINTNVSAYKTKRRTLSPIKSFIHVICILPEENLTVQTLTLGNQVCVCALCEVQTGSEPESLQTHRPSRMIQGESRSGCRPEPEEQNQLPFIR